jgi:hypothetical protein
MAAVRCPVLRSFDEPQQKKVRMLRLRGRIASLLHRAAWAVEPRYFN